MSVIVERASIIFGIEAQTKEHAILQLIKKMKEQNKITETKDFLKDVLDREEESPTAVGYNIGLPHGRTKNVLQPAICFGRLINPIVWNEKTEEKVTIILLIAVPNNDGYNTHMKIISGLARKLMHEEYRNHLLNGNEEVVYTLLKEGLEEYQNAF